MIISKLKLPYPNNPRSYSIHLPPTRHSSAKPNLSFPSLTTYQIKHPLNKKAAITTSSFSLSRSYLGLSLSSAVSLYPSGYFSLSLSFSWSRSLLFSWSVSLSLSVSQSLLVSHQSLIPAPVPHSRTSLCQENISAGYFSRKKYHQTNYNPTLARIGFTTCRRFISSF